VTVHYTRSRIQLNGETAELIDLPGAYSLTASTPAESATRDFLLQEGVDTVINVIDASVLSRSLELTLQLVELGLPVVVCLNMIDEAHRKGIRIDDAALAGQLGIPVVETLAAEGVGVHELFQTALQLTRKPTMPRCRFRYHCDTETAITELAAWLKPNLSDQDCLPPRLLAIKLLEGDEHLLGMASASTQERTSAARRQKPVAVQRRK
jgi:ferrous iron transport protein B